MSKRFGAKITQLLFLLTVLLSPSGIASLKCRSEDGFSDAELKRVSRNCMRKTAENSRFTGTGSSSSSTSTNSASSYGASYQNNRNGQHYQPMHGYGQQNSNSDYDYDDEEDNNSSNPNNKYERNDDALRQQNRNRYQANRSGPRSEGASSANNERGRHFEQNSNGQYAQSNGGRNANGGSRNNDANGHVGNSGNNQKNAMQGKSNGNNHSNAGSGDSNNKNNNSNNNTYDNACVVHCFFEEMNMLNSDDYPDRNKVKYMLTKDIRERELRNFYTNTIQECFQYLESQRRRHDKCNFSRELINCMTEYAKANCDDWQEYNVMFN